MNLKDRPTIPGVKLFEHRVWSDHRGCFTRTFDYLEHETDGEVFNVRQQNVSVLSGLGTLKGMHLQKWPSVERKIVTCVVGSIMDVVVDLRIKSVTYGQYAMHQLNGLDGHSILIPAGVAHGMQNLEDLSIVLYTHSDSYKPKLESGVHALDSTLKIPWPVEPRNLSTRDRGLPPFLEWTDRSDL